MYCRSLVLPARVTLCAPCLANSLRRAAPLPVRRSGGNASLAAYRPGLSYCDRDRMPRRTSRHAEYDRPTRRVVGCSHHRCPRAGIGLVPRESRPRPRAAGSAAALLWHPSQIMRQRIDADHRNVRIGRAVPSRIECRAGIAPLRRTASDEMRERVHTGRRNVRIGSADTILYRRKGSGRGPSGTRADEMNQRIDRGCGNVGICRKIPFGMK